MRRLLVVLLVGFSLWAGTTGKIAGRVVDKDTGEGLPGVEIYLPDTPLGTITSSDGRFFLLNVPPGLQTVRTELVGYRPLVKTGVLVVVDQTSTVNFGLEPVVLNLNTEILVKAERPLIEPDRTSKQSVVTSAEIGNAPVHSLEDLLSYQGGVTTDARGSIHVRGGRSGEVAYLIDGIDIKDPLFGGFSGLVTKEAVEELVLLSGTFNAEYGNALSGVVNVVTKEGGRKLSGSLEYLTPTVNQSPYRKKNSLTQDKYDYQVPSVRNEFGLPLLGKLSGSFSGAIIKPLTFFISSHYLNQDSYLPFGYNLERNLQGKLTYRLKPVKLSLALEQGNNYYQNYNHAWKYWSSHYPEGRTSTDRLTLNITHTLSPRLFYILSVNRFMQKNSIQVGNKKPGEYVAGTAQDLEFYTEDGGGDYPLYQDARTTTLASRLDLTFQATNSHQFKTGVDVKSHDLELDQMTQLIVSGPYQFEKYRYQPLEAAAYVQDKIEYEYLIVNFGLRYDYADTRARMWPDIEEPSTQLLPAPKKTQLSPRLGLAHPITDQAVLHFAYGHFFQNPSYYEQYLNLQYLHPDSLVSGVLIGNPSIFAQKTVVYEVGIQQQLTQDYAFDLTAFYKDITDLLATTQVRWQGIDYVVFSNGDYGNVKGVDFSIHKRYSQYCAGSISYTYSVAKGNRSTPMEGFWNAYYEMPEAHQEYYLDFDRTHDLALNLDIRVPENGGPKIFSYPLFENSGLNLLVQYASGLPYSPYAGPGVRVEANSARRPWTGTVDLKANKDFKIFKTYLSGFVEVTNLFDRLNALYVYSRTGKPWDAGFEGLGSSPDAILDPSNVGPRRTIKAGLKWYW